VGFFYNPAPRLLQSSLLIFVEKYAKRNSQLKNYNSAGVANIGSVIGEKYGSWKSFKERAS